MSDDDFDDIKSNDADEYDGLGEVDYKCPFCNKYMREQATQFEGQRDMIIECVSCPMKYVKTI